MHPRGYASTLPSLRIGSHTRVIFQGFTGRQATANAKESLEWGTKIVGGTKPGVTGEHLGLPVFPTVRKAMEVLKPDATGIYVPAPLAPAAIEEAIEAEVPLIVAVAEHIPLHSMLKIHSMLATQSKSRLVGANSPGIISATSRCRIGFQPLPCFVPGKIGIAAKSGTLSYEAVASTTRTGLGQSLCIGVGGDILPGTDLREALEVLVDDEDTEAIALVGEIGGHGEIDAARWIVDYHSRVAKPKPIVALIAGVEAAPGRIMGHAGAFTMPGEPDARQKIEALLNAGVTMVNHPEKFGQALKARLGGQSYQEANDGPFRNGYQRRAMHTSSSSHTAQRRPRLSDRHNSNAAAAGQKRRLYLSQEQSFDLLRQQGINAADFTARGTQRLLAVGIDRSSRSPCVIASPTTDTDKLAQQVKRFPFDYRTGVDGLRASRIAEHLQLGHSSADSLRDVIRKLAALFVAEEAFLLETKIVERLGEVKVVGARFGLDDAVAHRITATEPQTETAEAVAARHGIVYIKLDGGGRIGTLVNGAGLAMNTVDALEDAGGRAANFLDTGGKATSETVRQSFELILRDERVKVVFVNIFGGITLGDMIARGVLLALRREELASINDDVVPVVVRIRGTNEEDARRIIAESGLPSVFAFDDFKAAAAKAIELSRT